jgi:transcriptional regulator with XRE-family HTH domain
VDNRETPDAGRTVDEMLADNLRGLRLLHRLEQADVAQRMRWLGHRWSRATVSQVERCKRAVSAPELLGLTLVFGETVVDLLDPLTTDRVNGRLELSQNPEWRLPLPAATLSSWLHGKTQLALTWDQTNKARGLRSAPDAAESP